MGHRAARDEVSLPVVLEWLSLVVYKFPVELWRGSDANLSGRLVPD
ncbi:MULTISPECIES: hypothetical protein [unclassified Synechococcus]